MYSRATRILKEGVRNNNTKHALSGIEREPRVMERVRER